MNKCLRIIITAKFSNDLLQSFIYKGAQRLKLEGTAQIIDPILKKVRISVCGKPDALDQFIDMLHTGTAGFELKNIEIEPFLKDKDYRSVFRVIE
jgi:hypothetical protein